MSRPQKERLGDSDAVGTTLAEPRRGMVRVWVGNGSGGEFANLKVTPAR